MSVRTSAHGERIEGPFLRVIGSLALNGHELRSLRNGVETLDDVNAEGWRRFADHLLESVNAVLDGATKGTTPGNTILVEREGATIPVGLDYLARLSAKLERHVRVGRALGVDDVDLSLAG